MGYIPLVPQRYILEGGLDVGADHARQTADLFAGDRVALVRHGGTALLAAGEVLFGFAHFGALQMAHFQGNLFAQGSGQGKGSDKSSVAITLDHLRGHGSGLQIEPRADAFFGLRSDVRERTHRAGDLADAQVFGCRSQPRQIAAGFAVPDSQFQAEGDGLGMYAVRAADLHGVFELEGAALQDTLAGSPVQPAECAHAWRICRACAVSTTSLDVRP